MNWNLSNATPYAATTMLVADRDGGDVWLTVIKATFDIAPDGTLSRAEKQFPIVFAPLFDGDPSRASLLADCDIDPAKPGVDVLVQGSAWAPEGRETRELVVSLEVGDRRKLLAVSGPRHWTRRAFGVSMSDAQPFCTMPLTYEHAFGGFDPADDTQFDERNPAGCGHARNPAHLLDREAPRIRYLGDSEAVPEPRPAGLGPLARHWLPRRHWAGTYDQAWRDERLPLLPADFDERFFMTAPEDQQFASLPPQAEVRIVGMSPHGRLGFRIPRLALGVNVHFEREEQHRRPVLRTLLILPDACKAVVTYADALSCTGRKYGITGTELIEKRFIQ